MVFLVIGGIYVGVCYACTKSIKKNKIIKIDKRLNNNSISLDDLNKINTSQKALSLDEMYEIIEKYTYDELKIFANVLVKNFPKEYLLNFFTNLNSLHLNKNIFLPFFGLLGANIPFLVNDNPNVLVLIPNSYIQKMVNNKTTPYHEFFHFASMIKTNDGWGLGCGFGYINKVNHFSLGLALNEGYTQLLSERYFQQEEETMGEAFSYKISKKIAKNLEVIIGKEKMEKLYLTADLKGLITELSSYDTIDNIIEFLKTFDALKKMVDNRDSLDITNNPIISDKLLFVQLYLVKIYIRSQLNLNNKLDIDFEKLSNNINNFVINLRKDLVIDDLGLKFDLSLLNKEIIDDLLNKEITLKNK